MIKIELLKQIYDAKIDFDTYCSLLVAQMGATYQFPDIDYTPYKLMGYVDFECKITKKGEELLARVGSVNIKKDVDFVKLHEKLQKELLALTGKKQKVLQNKYSFLPNSRDLETKLLKVSKKYSLKDWNRIEVLLLRHIKKSHKANWEFVTMLDYYIEKNNSSRLATDYDNFIEEEDKNNKQISSEIII